MKFYFNGELVRTSKTHEYKYGLLYMGKIKKCSKTKDALISEIERIKKMTYGPSGDIEYMKSNNYPQDEIENVKRETDARIATLKIVELEARA